MDPSAALFVNDHLKDLANATFGLADAALFVERLESAVQFYEEARHRDVVFMFDRLMNDIDSLPESPPKQPLKELMLSAPFVKDSSQFVKDCDKLVSDAEVMEGWKCVKSDKRELTLLRPTSERLAAFLPNTPNASQGGASKEGDYVTETHQIGVYYHHDKANHLHKFKTVTVMQLHVVYGCCVLLELELYPEWFPNCIASVDLGDVSGYHKAAYFVIKSPWPFENRDIHFSGRGLDDISTNRRVVIDAHSVTPEEATLFGSRVSTPDQLSHKKEWGKKCVRADFKCGAFVITMLDPWHVKVTQMVCIDPHISHVPQWALNWVSKNMLWEMMRQFERQTLNSTMPSSPYRECRRNKKERYAHLRERFNNVLEKLFGLHDGDLLPEDY